MMRQAGAAYSRRTDRVYFVLTVVYWMATYPYVPIVSAYAQSLNAAPLMIGLIGGAYGFTMLFLRLPVGILSDRIDRRKIFVVIGGVCAVAAAGVVALFPSLISLLFSRALCGAHASMWVPYTVLYARHYPPEGSARAMTRLSTFYSLGQLAAMLSGGILAEQFGYTAPFLLAGAFSILFVALSPLMQDIPREMAPSVPSPAALAEPKLSWRSVLNRRLILLTVIAVVFYYVKYATAYTFTPLIAKSLGATASVLGYLNTLYCLFGALGAAFSYKLARRVGVRGLLTGALIILAVFSAFVVPYLNSLALLYVTLAVSGFCTFLLDALLSGLVILGVPESRRSTVMGFYQAIYGLGILLGPVISGAVIDLSGISAAFFVAGWITIACAAVTAIVLPPISLAE